MTSASDAAQALREKAARLSDLKPVMKVIAQEFDVASSRAIRDQRSPAGDPFPKLAPSTLAKRAAKVPGARARRRGKLERALGLPGKGLTAGARRKRAAAIAAYNLDGSGILALADTDRLKNSIAYIATKDGMRVRMVAYTLPHVTGSQRVSGHPPKRNPLVIEPDGEIAADGTGSFVLEPHASEAFMSAINEFIMTGNVAVSSLG